MTTDRAARRRDRAPGCAADLCSCYSGERRRCYGDTDADYDDDAGAKASRRTTTADVAAAVRLVIAGAAGVCDGPCSR